MKLTVTGLDESIKKMGKYGKVVKMEIAEQFGIAARKWEKLAKNTVSSSAADTGFLMGKISAEQHGRMTWIVVSQADYSAFVEWGTRLKTKVPPELQAYAAQFKGSAGKGNAREAIYEWCRRKGIHRKAWWFIYIQLMTEGMNPHPFFFIHQHKVTSELQKDINKVIQLVNERRA